MITEEELIEINRRDFRNFRKSIGWRHSKFLRYLSYCYEDLRDEGCYPEDYKICGCYHAGKCRSGEGGL